jgi:hypothetical protein
MTHPELNRAVLVFIGEAVAAHAAARGGGHRAGRVGQLAHGAEGIREEERCAIRPLP